MATVWMLIFYLHIDIVFVTSALSSSHPWRVSKYGVAWMLRSCSEMSFNLYYYKIA